MKIAHAKLFGHGFARRLGQPRREATTLRKLLAACGLLVLITTAAKAQDQIIQKDKSIIQANVLEITDDAVRYKRFDFPDGPIYNIKKADTFLIIYKNGRSESFAPAAPPAESAPPPAAAETVREPEPPAPAPYSAPAPMPRSTTGSSGTKPTKKDSRFLVGIGAYERLYELGGGTEPGLVGKVGAEYLNANTQSSGIGVAANYLMDVYVQVDNESAEFSKYYLSLYYFKEFDIKFLSLGVLAGPGANYTSGTYKSSSSSSGNEASFFTGGLHAGQYVQTYLGKNAQQEKSFFLRLGFDQFVMLEGSFSSTMSLSIGF